VVIAVPLAGLIGSVAIAADLPKESDYYRLERCVTPPNIVLEVGGILPVDANRVMVCTRRGEVWTITNPWSEKPEFLLSLDGLQEPLGLLAPDGPDRGIYVAQRGELSRMVDDAPADGRIDRIETVCDDWDISGNYHEYTFGPARDANGDLWITLNRPFGAGPFGEKDWRGWGVRVDRDGRAHFEVAGLRSPCGVGASPDGEIFYTDNQGEWCATSKLAAIHRGEFHGHPWGVASCRRPESRVETPADGNDRIPNGLLMPEAARQIQNFTLPAVWFPYDKVGRSASGFVWDTTGGRFGPFEGQVFVGDKYSAEVLRVDLEKVDGRWQGAVFPFRSGCGSGIVRVAWLPDGSLALGETNRGWASRGEHGHGLERLVWTGKTPFDIHRMRAIPGGFRLEFTERIDPTTAGDPASYEMISYTYYHHEPYGSPEIDTKPCAITKATVAEDGKSVELAVEGLREVHVHELHAKGVRNAAGVPLLHGKAYYTLNRLVHQASTSRAHGSDRP
jgi:hypothetical protein